MTDMPEVAMDVKGLCERLVALHRAFVTGIASRDAREGRLTESRAREWAEECVELFRGDLEPVATALRSLAKELAEARADARMASERHATSQAFEAAAKMRMEAAEARALAAEAAAASKDERIREADELLSQAINTLADPHSGDDFAGGEVEALTTTINDGLAWLSKAAAALRARALTGDTP